MKVSAHSHGDTLNDTSLICILCGEPPCSTTSPSSKHCTYQPPCSPPVDLRAKPPDVRAERYFHFHARMVSCSFTLNTHRTYFTHRRSPFVFLPRGPFATWKHTILLCCGAYGRLPRRLTLSLPRSSSGGMINSPRKFSHKPQWLWAICGTTKLREYAMLSAGVSYMVICNTSRLWCSPSPQGNPTSLLSNLL